LTEYENNKEDLILKVLENPDYLQVIYEFIPFVNDKIESSKNWKIIRNGRRWLCCIW
jgi:hypothetical protein